MNISSTNKWFTKGMIVMYAAAAIGFIVGISGGSAGFGLLGAWIGSGIGGNLVAAGKEFIKMMKAMMTGSSDSLTTILTGTFRMLTCAVLISTGPIIPIVKTLRKKPDEPEEIS